MLEQVQNWKETYGTELTEEALRSAFQPSNRFYFSVRRYPAATSFNGTCRAGKHFILSGCCKFKFLNEVILSEGQFFEHPGGDYQFTVLGEEEARFVGIWELPEEFWENSDASGIAIN